MPDPAAWAIVEYLGPVVWLAALLSCALMILVLTPVLRNAAMAVPTHRSSHVKPTPQWGGLAITCATLGVTLLAIYGYADFPAEARTGTLLAVLAALLLLLLGAVDDFYHLEPKVKLLVQALAAALMLAALPGELRTIPMLPLWLERAILLVGTVWFINLVNFMDGIDWMMVAEVVPLTAGVAIIGALGALPPAALVVALALNGAMLGFAPFNRPVASLFMGDMGSLPIGLLLAWLLIVVAGSGYVIAAVLLPLYFVADTGLTIVRRARAGERLSVAHRTHFYQRARDNGFTNMQIVGRVLAVNIGLVVLAALSVVAQAPLSSALALLAGAGLVAWLMIGFAIPRVTGDA
ncbi:glycosyl transferase [Hyphomicrobium sp. xq]|uniref:Glycosyl transferase n=1 Tax=Hyphomicrobium album TaxID=2665159 RepID=A0A6I3KL29_9HYPH|nr:glycosyl transferase [Hyphomicrobium album]MTD95844.1 glycosyl transferase [Hyphomicrobium album]